MRITGLYKTYWYRLFLGTKILSPVCTNSGISESGIRAIDCLYPDYKNRAKDPLTKHGLIFDLTFNRRQSGVRLQKPTILVRIGPGHLRIVDVLEAFAGRFQTNRILKVLAVH